MVHLDPLWSYRVCSYGCLDLDTFLGGGGAHWGPTSEYTPELKTKC